MSYKKMKKKTSNDGFVHSQEIVGLRFLGRYAASFLWRRFKDGKLSVKIFVQL